METIELNAVFLASRVSLPRVKWFGWKKTKRTKWD
jgi:hypothetical protein